MLTQVTLHNATYQLCTVSPGATMGFLDLFPCNQSYLSFAKVADFPFERNLAVVLPHTAKAKIVQR